MTKEQKRAYDRLWYARNREHRLAQCAKNYRLSKDRYSARARLYRYGAKLDWYEATVAEQKGACAICGRIPKRQLDTDHDHVTGELRGLLCHLCNTALSRIENIPDWTARAESYLAKFRK
jgi:hypothetical protein